MKKYRWLAFLLIVLLSVSLVVGCGGGEEEPEGTEGEGAEEAVTLKLAHQWPAAASADEGDFRARLALMFKEQVEEKSGGSLQVDLYPAESLVKAKQEFEALRTGSLDLTILPLDYAGGMVPQLNVTLMPALVKSHEQAAAWRTSEIGAKLTEILAEYNIKPLVWIWCAGGIGTKGDPIVAPSDVPNGLKLRAAGARVESMFEKLGAGISSMPSSEIYTAMQTGVLDAAVTSSGSFASYRLYEQVKSYTAPTKNTFWFMFEPMLISTVTWDKLSDEQKQIIEEVSAELETVAYEEAKKDDQVVAELFKEKGVDVYEIDDAAYEQWVEAAKPVWDEFAAEVEGGQELIDLARAAE